jgi:hypothetical protein
MALDHARRELAAARRRDGCRFRQTEHLDGPRPVRQAADEIALFERKDQTMDAGLRTQIERLLHLVEGRRDALLLQALVNEAQQLVLLLGQHDLLSPSSTGESLRPALLFAVMSRRPLNKS